MFSIEQAKHMAAKLKASLALHEQTISYSTALEMVSHQLGFRDWNTAAASLRPQVPESQIQFSKSIPILRIFDIRKAQEFYLEFLSFSVEFEHRFAPDLPLYMASSAMVCSCIFLNITVTPPQAQRYLSR
ncbi:glyoxalase superfamily protein [Phytobacter diazotrophicus]|uniref:glyoxalase superfamily protein n=1 Tax=Phytobacter diazotrophicus TaxID=395631 RepID=UPI00290C553E|nr:glyoxalase superfamily protein [Enterobacteriaceae bacterium]